eukprot:4816950-Amphidinium_carterae.1
MARVSPALGDMTKLKNAMNKHGNIIVHQNAGVVATNDLCGNSMFMTILHTLQGWQRTLLCEFMCGHVGNLVNLQGGIEKTCYIGRGTNHKNEVG